MLLFWGIGSSKQYLVLMWFDAIINNVDRHNENLGIMRDKKTGRILSLAPNFDNNLCLIARNTTLNLDASKDGMIKVFLSFIRTNKKARSIIKTINFPVLNKEIIQKCLDGLDANFDLELLQQYILSRYEYIKSAICNL